MIALHLDNVSVTYIAVPIFTSLSWEVHDDRCVGLVGPNGAGKSTLLRLMAGQLTSDSGYLNRKSGLTVGYLRQEPDFAAGRTLWEEAMTASPRLAAVETKLDACEQRLSDPEVYGDEATLAAVLTEQEKLLAQFTELGGPAYEGKVRSVLARMGFGDEASLSLSTDVLSGGQKKLLGLAKLLIVEPDLLLLD